MGLVLSAMVLTSLVLHLVRFALFGVVHKSCARYYYAYYVHVLILLLKGGAKGGRNEIDPDYCTYLPPRPITSMGLVSVGCLACGRRMSWRGSGGFGVGGSCEDDGDAGAGTGTMANGDGATDETMESSVCGSFLGSPTKKSGGGRGEAVAAALDSASPTKAPRVQGSAPSLTTPTHPVKILRLLPLNRIGGTRRRNKLQFLEYRSWVMTFLGCSWWCCGIFGVCRKLWLLWKILDVLFSIE